MNAQQSAAEKAAVMLAFSEGKEIEFTVRTRPLGGWSGVPFTGPIWDWNYLDYRVKPEEPKPRTVKLSDINGRVEIMELNGDFRNMDRGTFIELLPGHELVKKGGEE